MPSYLRHDPSLKEIKDLVLGHRNFYILEHQRPDGDCVGSGLAVALALSGLGKKALLISDDPHPKVFCFLPGHEHLRLTTHPLKEFPPEVAIFVDCTGPDRPGSATSLVEGKKWINIDHHCTNSFFGHVNFVDPSASATGELIYDVVLALGAEITLDIATCLYVAIITDTGGFRYQNTTAHTLRLAAALLDKGVDAHYISEKVFQDRSLSSVMLIGRALQGLELYLKGQAAFVTISKKMMEDVGASLEDTEDIINYPRSINGVEVAAVLKETEGGFQVSLRSKFRVDVGSIALSLGGGGHPRAAGAILKGSADECKALLISKIREAL